MLFNKLRSLLSHSRIPLRIAAMNPRPKVFRVRITSREKGSLILTSFGILTLTLGMQMLTGQEDQIYFLPMSVPKAVPQPPFAKDDPIQQTYRKFIGDRKKREQVIEKVLDSAVKAMDRQKRFGKGMRCDVHWLWFNFPASPPPEYVQGGLAISRSGIHWTTRSMPYRVYHRLMNYIWPSWMFSGLLNSFYRIRDRVRDEVAKEIEEDNLDTETTVHVAIPHPFFAGKLAFQDVDNFRRDLIKTIRFSPPPSKGHVTVDGVLQLSTETHVMHADVEATFNPENIKDFKLTHMKVRHVALYRRNERPPAAMRKILLPPAAALAPPIKAESMVADAKQIIGKIRLQDAESVTGAVGAVNASSANEPSNSTVATDSKSEKTSQISQKRDPIDSPVFDANSKQPDNMISPPPASQSQVKPKPRPKEEQ